MRKVMIKQTTRIIGIEALAKELDVTRFHLYKVIKGERKSARLEAKLAKRGITIGQSPAVEETPAHTR